MDVTAAVDSTTKIQPDQSVTDTSTRTDTTTSAATTAATTATTATTVSKFETFLRSKLGINGAGNVSEEALFASLVENRVAALKGADTAAKYDTALTAAKTTMAKPDGYIPLEDAAKSALTQLRSSGDLTKEDADKVYTEAFNGAQLDSNTNALYDDRGGPKDTTVAMADIAAAATKAQGVIDQLTAGTLTLTSRSLDEADAGKTSAAATSKAGTTSAVTAGGVTSGTNETKTLSNGSFDGADGFLFKPISNGSKTLAVLLPESYKGNVAGVTIMDAAGKVLDDGTSTGFGDDGSREKFSFHKPGGDYGDNLTVGVNFLDGTHIDYAVPDGSKRYD